MKSFQKVTFTIAFAAIMFMSFPCAGQKTHPSVFEEQTPFTIKPVHFQEWYAGIKIGATGLNVYIPVANEAENVSIDLIYFRNLSGKLEKNEDQYEAVLKNRHSQYTFRKSKRPKDYPFTLLDDECVISYLENGVRKYYKIKQVNEVAGTYYEKGPPTLFLEESRSSMANLDSDDDDN